MHACLVCWICMHANTMFYTDANMRAWHALHTLSSSPLSEVPPPWRHQSCLGQQRPRFRESHRFTVNCRLKFSAVSLLAPLGFFCSCTCLYPPPFPPFPPLWLSVRLSVTGKYWPLLFEIKPRVAQFASTEEAKQQLARTRQRCFPDAL